MWYSFFCLREGLEKIGRMLEEVARKIKIVLISLVSDTLGLKVLFSIGYDNISAQRVVITLVSDTLDLECVVFLLF